MSLDVDAGGSPVEVRVLGPLEVRGGGAIVALPPRVQDLLAMLSCRPNVVVPADQLIDALWRTEPPRTSSKSLQVRVHELRRALGNPTRVAHRRQGYALVLGLREVDASAFEELVGQGRAEIGAGRPGPGSELIRQALRMWRGSPFAGQEHLDLVRQEAARLDELRWQAVEELTEADLALGRHADIVGDLRNMVAEHPFREGPQAQLMVALYRLGRHAEALEVYQRARRVLVDELGVEPGRRLRDLQRAILAEDPALDATARTESRVRAGAESPRPVAPAELPLAVSAFTGRDSEVARLRLALTRPSGPMAIAAISGTGGVGKSALAIHTAHAVAGEFPDGQLFVNLHGATAGMDPLAPADVLARFLRALGVESAPNDLEEAAGRFRSLTATRRMLIVLDDAADAVQVRPLLPGGGGCAVLVTSRQALSTLDGAAHLHLDTLSETEALRLLGQLAGRDRVGGELRAAEQIVRFCGHLPLAVRISGARLIAQPARTLASYAEQLSDARRRLDELRHDDLAVRTSITASHRDLESRPNGAYAFHVLKLIALLDVADTTAAVAAALADRTLAEAQAALDDLTETQLLEMPAPGRYRMHDLINLYVRERADADISGPDGRAAVERALDHYIAAACRATELLDAGQARWLTPTAPDSAPAEGLPRSVAEAVEWLDAERVSLLAAANQAAALSDAGAATAIRLVAAATVPLDVRGYMREASILLQTAEQAAQRLGDRSAEARASMFLGYMLGRMGDAAGAATHAERALALFREAGDRLGESGALNASGGACMLQGRWADGIDCLTRALAIRQELGDREGEAMLLDNIGCAYRVSGRLDEAIACSERSLALSREIGYRRGETHALANLAETHRLAAHYDSALLHYDQSRRMHRELGDRLREAAALWGLGATLHDLDQHDQARARWSEALAILYDAGCITADQLAEARHAAVPSMPETIRLLMV